MFVDTHCHLSIRDYDNIDLVIKNNIDSGVDKIIVSACEMGDFEEAVSLLDKYNSVYLTLGFYPSEVSKVKDSDLEKLKEFLKLDRVVGVGEIGLDYHYGKDDYLEQIELFEKQLKIAEEVGLPVVIHTRDAVNDTINTLKKYRVTGVIHCFSGSVETADIYIKMGYKLGIGGVVTFKNSNLYKVVEHVGLSNIVLETDAPYLAPVPYRGMQNSSKYIPIIAEKVAEVLNVSLEEVAVQTSLNACNLFDLN